MLRQFKISSRNVYGKYKIVSFAWASSNAGDMQKRREELMAKGLPKRKPIEGVKNIILVTSGKGGVGKSTIAVNLAVALKSVEPSKEVGLLDADLFGPSVPLMMNLHDSPLLDKNNFMLPLINYGVKCMSMGFLIPEGSPVIWRGLMVMQALDRLLRQVTWDKIDYLIVDTPPGTGDTHLSLIQNLPITGTLIITTPQSASVQVAKRGAAMFKKLNVPIIGVIENMSFIKCPKCNNNIQMYNNDIKKFVKEIGSELLEQIPLETTISHCTDTGTPIVIKEPDTLITEHYKNLAGKVISFLNKRTL